MTSNMASRRSALKLILAGSVVAVGTGCGALQSLPRGQAGGSTDGSELALRVRQALREHPFTSQMNVDVSSSGDEVVIKGLAANQAEIANVDLVANQVEGVSYALVDMYIRK